MELIKRTIDVSEANGWYLLETQKRFWLEPETDEDTGNTVEVEKSEILCKKGLQINDIIMSMLQENGIKQISVSNVPLLGHQDKNLNLWETLLRVRTSKTNNKQTFIATGDCPSAAEQFVAQWFEMNVDGTCEFINVKSQDYKKVIKLYETEADELDKEEILWFKCQVYSMLDSDDDGESHSAGSKNLLVQATSFENAILAIKAVMNRNEFDAIYNTFKSLQELKLEEVFVPEENVSYYSQTEIENE